MVGKHCESGDVVVKDVYLPGDVHAGDLLVVPVTGAYCWSLASNYNWLPRPGIVAVDPSGRAHEIVRRERVTDLLARDPGVDQGSTRDENGKIGPRGTASERTRTGPTHRTGQPVT